MDPLSQSKTVHVDNTPPLIGGHRAVREAQELGRQAYCDMTGAPMQTLINMENGRNEPSVKLMQKIVDVFLQYTMWFMHEHVIEEAGQISPQIEKARADLKKTGTDTN